MAVTPLDNYCAVIWPQRGFYCWWL